MEYPRPLRPKELDLLETVLPAERTGYRRLRERIRQMQVIAQGRRGEGELILGFSGDEPDLISPLPPVIAYGMVETTRDTYSVTVREETGSQINIEIVSHRGEAIPDHYEEKRRWSYSTWRPGSVSPATDAPVCEVALDQRLTLAFATAEKRIWLHDAATGMVYLIPITNYYNELMLHKRIRDPKIALSPSLLWEELDSYTEGDLRAAFVAYNTQKRRVEIHPSPPQQRTLSSILKNLFAGKS